MGMEPSGTVAIDDISASETSDQRTVEERITTCLVSNHGNTLPLLAFMRTCIEARPFREVEDEVDDLSVMHMTHQSPHALADILLNCGALEKIIVEEDGSAAPVATTNSATSAVPDEALDTLEPSALDENAEPEADIEVEGEPELEDQPVDYLLQVSAAGLKVLEDFDPLKRFARMIAGEPETYFDAYKQVLVMCEQGRRFAEIEEALAGHPSLKDPKQIFPGYFVSKLETVDGISWQDDRWVTTEHGREMEALL